MRESYIGQLLVASSTVTDPMFANGVCLIVHDDETRVIGVMLNRPIEPNSEAFETILGETDSKQPEPSQPRFSVETICEIQRFGVPAVKFYEFMCRPSNSSIWNADHRIE
mgnify:CR=1 FL=1